MVGFRAAAGIDLVDPDTPSTLTSNPGLVGELKWRIRPVLPRLYVSRDRGVSMLFELVSMKWCVMSVLRRRWSVGLWGYKPGGLFSRLMTRETCPGLTRERPDWEWSTWQELHLLLQSCHDCSLLMTYRSESGGEDGNRTQNTLFAKQQSDLSAPP